MIRLAWGHATDTGRVRDHNEDNLLVSERVFAVADGMGGHQGGEVASQVAVEVLGSSVVAPTTEALVEGVQRANEAIFDRAADERRLYGMGTTICALGVIDAGDEGQRLAVLNVGDSRAYVLEDGELRQITDDHSLVEEWVRNGLLSQDEAAVHPQRNVLTRALGIEDEVEVDAWETEAEPGDRYLLCSDGLFNEVHDNLIAATLRNLADPQETARELVRLANEGGGRDNITVVIIDVLDDDDDDPDRPRATTITAQWQAPPDLAGFETAVADEDAAGDEATDNHEPDQPTGLRRLVRKFSWRSALFTLSVVAVLVVAVVAVGFYARGTQYVGLDDGEVVVYKGRPGGVLWFDPTVEERSGISTDELTPAMRDELADGVDQPSLDAARAYLDQLGDQLG